MYCTHYNFSEKPFEITPDPSFLYMTPSHQEALATIIYGIENRRGFVEIVGEVGTGKTTLLNAALDQLAHEIKVAFISNTDVSFKELLNQILVEFGLKNHEQNIKKSVAIQSLNEFATKQLVNNSTVAIIIDEAQNLSVSCLEKLRFLSNLETRKHKLLQIVLSGQPELDKKLEKPELRQLKQRITLKRLIDPLNERETYNYIQHRLSISKNENPSLFVEKAQNLIWQYSEGIPRKINVLSDNALLIGFGLGVEKISEEIVAEAANDLSWDQLQNKETKITSNPIFSDSHNNPNGGIKKRRVILFLGLVLFSLSGGLFIGLSNSNMQKEYVNNSEPEQDIVLTDDENDLMPDHGDFQRSKDQNKKERSEFSFFFQNKYSLFRGEHLSLSPEDNEIHYQIKSSLVSPENLESALKGINNHIIVKAGDSLSKILIRNYGSYNEKVLTEVLQHNPDVHDPNVLFVGQTIKLP